jgi:hypothetical protein
MVAAYFGIRFEGIELRIEGIDGFWHCGGRLRGAELPENADNRRLQKQLTVIMAGYAAQSLLAPTNGSLSPSSSSRMIETSPLPSMSCARCDRLSAIHAS